MKQIRTIFILLILAIGVYSCGSGGCPMTQGQSVKAPDFEKSNKVEQSEEIVENPSIYTKNVKIALNELETITKV